ncbi:acyl-ACP--UDP-N-acetylglucosamine O-acyltransferase [Lacibacterium aquatile]|uniref:Acyl-[acyl-carrier-protein]--UDP-N-acetylglucosamine O-acyltransferase n=1 Tax=Lacibacterium aquatile TaxID=1168082 RepID=A0ABW5DMT6_9PROT
MVTIHPSSLVEAGAELGEGVEIGPFCHVGPHVKLGDRVRLVSHVVVAGHTTIGEGTELYPFSAAGLPPQHRGYKNEPTELIIGKNCVIREQATLHPGTTFDEGRTVVGDNCLLMVATHIAHDCVVGNNVVMANGAVIGGHVKVGDFVTFGGMCAVHQFVRIGKYAMIGGMSGVENDVIPYGSVMGDRARLAGLNVVGLKRRGFDRDAIHLLRKAYRLMFAAEGTMAERLDDVLELFQDNQVVMDIVEFVRADSARPICQPRV